MGKVYVQEGIEGIPRNFPSPIGISRYCNNQQEYRVEVAMFEDFGGGGQSQIFSGPKSLMTS